MKHTVTLLTTLLLAPLPALHAADTSQPNVLLVMADDLAFSDLKCYGSEIQTPNLDRLATDGLRFTQFYNTAKCHSSRISLLTGRYAYQAGNTALSRRIGEMNERYLVPVADPSAAGCQRRGDGAVIAGG